MSCYLHRESAAAFAQRRPFSRHVLLATAIAWVRVCRKRRRERQELLDYMAGDHRAAADIGITSYDARNWSERPFWRA